MNKTRKRPIPVTAFLTVSSLHGCIACWQCVDACPRKVLGKVKFLWHKHVKIDNPQSCIGCGKCVTVCPQSIFILNR